MREATVQKLAFNYADAYDRAFVYFSILSALNSLELQKKEIELLSFVSVRGGVSLDTARDEFCEKYKTTPNVLANLKSKLLKKELIYSVGDIIHITPEIKIDFKLPLILNLVLDEDRTDHKNDSGEAGSGAGDSREGGETPVEGS